MSNFVLDRGFRVPVGAGAVTAHRFVAASGTDGYVDLTPSSKGAVIGVVMENVDSAKVDTGNVTVDIRLIGIAPVQIASGVTLTLGQQVATTTSGQATSATTSDVVAGVAMQAGSNLAVIDVLLTPGNHVI